MRDISELELKMGGQPEFSAPATEADLASLESEFQFKLNRDHREFLLASAGGFLGLSTFKNDAGDEYEIGVLYAAGSAALAGNKGCQ